MEDGQAELTWVAGDWQCGLYIQKWSSISALTGLNVTPLIETDEILKPTSLYKFYGATMTIKSRLRVRFLSLVGFSQKNVQFWDQIWHFKKQKKLNVKFSFSNHKKHTTVSEFPINGILTKNISLYFTHFYIEALWIDLHQNFCRHRVRWHDHSWKIFLAIN